MKWQNLSVNETLSALDTNRHGLSNEEAQRRILKFGKNELIEEKKDSPLKLFLTQFRDILIILLIVAS